MKMKILGMAGKCTGTSTANSVSEFKHTFLLLPNELRKEVFAN